MSRPPYDPAAPRGEEAPRPTGEPGPEATSTLPGSDPDYGFGAAPPPFRLDRASVARIPLPTEPATPLPAAYAAPAQPRDRIFLHAGLFLATLATTTLAGVDYYASFLTFFKPITLRFSWGLLVNGLWYSGPLLAILAAHEFGHYFACRYYRVSATLPFFIPAPFVLTGTLGAVIRIRQPIHSKRVLFDMGIAGPLAGFVLAVPALIIGLAMSHIAQLPKSLPPNMTGMEYGEPVLFKLVAWLMLGPVADGYSLNVHPVAWAAWWGMLVTAINLFPFSQLDGGHISYAVFGRASSRITLTAVGTAIALVFVSRSWIVWTLLLVGMLIFFGPHHPQTLDEDVPLDRRRKILAAVALIIFILCFTPAPIQPLDLLHK